MPQHIANWNPARGVWETNETSLCGHSEPYSETWPSSGMTRSGVAYALPTWEPPTTDTESSSLLATPPQARDGEKGLPGEEFNQKNLVRDVSLLPTPTASDQFGAGAHGDGGADLRTTVSLLPTPAARDAGRGAGWGDQSGRPLSETVHRLLPTPRATDGTKGGPNQAGSSGDLMLPSAAASIGATTPPPLSGGSERSDE